MEAYRSELTLDAVGSKPEGVLRIIAEYRNVLNVLNGYVLNAGETLLLSSVCKKKTIELTGNRRIVFRTFRTSSIVWATKNVPIFLNILKQDESHLGSRRPVAKPVHTHSAHDGTPLNAPC